MDHPAPPTSTDLVDQVLGYLGDISAKLDGLADIEVALNQLGDITQRLDETNRLLKAIGRELRKQRADGPASPGS